MTMKKYIFFHKELSVKKLELPETLNNDANNIKIVKLIRRIEKKQKRTTLELR